MAISLNAAIVRIRAANDRIVGTGFLVEKRQALTCAHVIAQALDVPEDAPEAPLVRCAWTSRWSRPGKD